MATQNFIVSFKRTFKIICKILLQILEIFWLKAMSAILDMEDMHITSHCGHANFLSWQPVINMNPKHFFVVAISYFELNKNI
jgi:hypothetical protein